MGYVIYLSFLAISMIIVIFLGAFTVLRTDGKKTMWFTAVMLCLFLYLLGIFLGAVSTTMEAAFNAKRVEILGSYFMGPFILFFIAEFCKIKLPRYFRVPMLILPIIFVVLLWTTHIHGLTYATMGFSERTYQGLARTSGPFRFFPHFYNLFCVLISSIMIIHRLINWSAKFRVNLLMLLFMPLVPAVINPVYSANIGGIADAGIHLTSIALAFSSIFIWFNVVKLNMFDIFSEAMKMALRFTKEAFILIDSENNFLHANESAIKIFPELETMPQDSKIAKIKNWPFNISKNDTVSAHVKFELDRDRYYAATIDAISDDNSKMLGYIILIQDISELVILAKNAEKANKAKSRFLATMSHEIRTPMNTIMGLSQIQLQKKNLPEEYVSSLEKIYSSGSNLLGIINDILDLSKIETGKMELVPLEYDVPSLIHDTVQLNIVWIGLKPIEFILDVDKNLPSRLIGDELRIKQIINNLLSNAIKYTEKGYVKLSVKHEVCDKNIKLFLTVEDTGQGMRPEDCEKLFSHYLRFDIEANRTIEGTGIGLEITKNLTELMNGTIEVTSEYGKGSIFTVSVQQQPVECEPIGYELSEKLRNFTFFREKQFSDEQIRREPMPYGKVLIVDDIDINLYVTEEMLLPYELKIETVISGFAAIEKVENGGIYDIIFMDHMMPLMDGIETTRKLRSMGYNGVIVALTANALVGNDELFKKQGFDGFISKPVDVRELDAVLNEFVRDKHKRFCAG